MAEKQATAAQAAGESPQERSDASHAGQAPQDDFVTTQHTISTTSGELTYQAVAGRMVISEPELDEGTYRGEKPKAQVFITSYTKLDAAGEPDRSRPVIFAFNGGPGSSSVWLHIGLFGPKRVTAHDAEGYGTVPHGLVDNAETTLAEADLVFIDPMTTGYSRAVEGTKPGDYHGFTGDRDLVGEAIRIWLSRNHRWLSPKFLAGESYGTTRAAALAGYLAQRHGIALNGVILISAVLDFGTVFFSEGNDQPYVHFLPTYAAVAHYHGFHPGKTLEDIVVEAQEFADHEYTLALARGSRLSAEKYAQVATRYAQLTGLDQRLVELNDLRIDAFTFFGELLKDQKLRVGRLDSRFTAQPGRQSDTLLNDPSYPVIQYPYTAAMNHLLGAHLRYQSDLVYEIITREVHPWSYQEFENRHVNTAEDLASAMRSNPDLKVYVGFGYHDAATPFAACEHVLAQLRIPAEAQQAIMRQYYPAGHMMYVHQPSRVQQLEDIVAFMRWSVGQAEKPRDVTPGAS